MATPARGPPVRPGLCAPTPGWGAAVFVVVWLLLGTLCTGKETGAPGTRKGGEGAPAVWMDGVRSRQGGRRAGEWEGGAEDFPIPGVAGDPWGAGVRGIPPLAEAAAPALVQREQEVKLRERELGSGQGNGTLSGRGEGPPPPPPGSLEKAEMGTWAHSEISTSWGNGTRAPRAGSDASWEIEIKKQRPCPLGSKVSVHRGLVGRTSGLG